MPGTGFNQAPARRGSEWSCKKVNSPLIAFEQGMRELGYVDDQNIDIEYRFADGQLDRFPMLAGELIRLSPNVILAAVTPAAVAARALTQTIPIVCPLLADPIRFGLIVSEARPRGNVTGVLFRLQPAAAPILTPVMLSFVASN